MMERVETLPYISTLSSVIKRLECEGCSQSTNDLI